MNLKFYETVAENFNRSRQYFWQGWQKLEPLLKNLEQKQGKANVFDVGCGNARLAEFLDELHLEFSYVGLENNAALIKHARKRLKRLNINHKLIEFDLIKGLISGELKQKIDQKFNLITAFGLIHHIPGFKLRVKLLQQLAELLNTDGSLVITAWQFAADDRFKNRMVKPETIGFKPADLEKNDYILDWKKGKRAFRYCHFVKEEEVKRLNEHVPELSLEKTYYADGKSGELNRYLIFKKL